jgi:hypothetical protein
MYVSVSAQTSKLVTREHKEQYYEIIVSVAVYCSIT